MPLGKNRNKKFNYSVAAIYHPPDHVYDPNHLVEYLIDFCERLLPQN